MRSRQEDFNAAFVKVLEETAGFTQEIAPYYKARPHMKTHELREKLFEDMGFPLGDLSEGAEQ